MGVEFGSPFWLGLLAGLPVVWLAGRVGHAARACAAFTPACAAVCCSCLIGALAQPVLSWPASRIAVIYLVDASHSVATQAARVGRGGHRRDERRGAAGRITHSGLRPSGREA